MNKKYFKLISGTILALCLVTCIGLVGVFFKDVSLKKDSSNESAKNAGQKTALSETKKGDSSQNNTTKSKEIKSNKKAQTSQEIQNGQGNQSSQGDQSSQGNQSSQFLVSGAVALAGFVEACLGAVDGVIKEIDGEEVLVSLSHNVSFLMLLASRVFLRSPPLFLLLLRGFCFVSSLTF